MDTIVGLPWELAVSFIPVRKIKEVLSVSSMLMSNSIIPDASLVD